MTPLQQNTSLVTQRLDRATAIASPATGLPIKCFVFGTDGSVQVIDAGGVVRPIASSSGSIIPTVDNTSDLGSASLRWRAGYFGTSVQTPLLNTQVGGLPTSVMALAAAASAVNIVTVTSAALSGAPSIAATGSDTNITLTIAAKGTGSIAMNSNVSLSGAAPTITATTADQGIALVSSGTGTISLNAGATGSVQLGGNAGALIGEYGVAPTARSAAIANPAGGATVDAEARAAINALLAYFRLRGTVTP